MFLIFINYSTSYVFTLVTTFVMMNKRGLIIMAKSLKDLNKTSERVFKNGNSKAISLSKKTIRLANFDIGDTVEVQKMNGGLFITKKKESIEDRIKNFFQSGGKYTELEVDWEERVGREI
ncbi:conserved hypothetical protein (plasmid) [Staphylococcus aureus subsp. aureus ED98]|uniref:PemI family antitoxin n=4 Tax=Staphylococcus TaxID=1279 RepID=A0A499S1T5_STAAU|nr:conserved hypothetical protein [Staphylococcus aureus subsp. aureus ED98]AYK27905.1 PemI family antitoxin [Staphylococcus aureus]AYK27983.1 PemI family antitoxin [Staphylococcus aureus]AYK28009.1 PemI family antitoxin [Staphylococcus aureus]AYK28072.1 PemI family antitoxin [Staphylococcus aureus]